VRKAAPAAVANSWESTVTEDKPAAIATGTNGGEDIDALADGRLDLGTAIQTLDRIESDPDAAARFRSVRRLNGMLRELSTDPAPAPVPEHLHAAGRDLAEALVRQMLTGAKLAPPTKVQAGAGKLPSKG
jgi:anti-sigma factor RsiW